MIIDLRTYTMMPGRLNAFLKLYEEEGLPIQLRHQGQPVGYFVTEIGPQNQIVHLWRYDSIADRELRRAALAADADWVAYRVKSGETGNVQYQENKILVPARFSPMK